MNLGQSFLFASLVLSLISSGCSGNKGAASDGGDDDGGDAGPFEVADEWLDCVENSDCQLVQRNQCACCWSHTLANSAAINKKHATDYADADPCKDNVRGCGCDERGNAWIIATCDQGTCKAIDLHDVDATSCTEASQCKVRTATCCGCYDENQTSEDYLISASGDLSDLTCDSEGGACEPCDNPGVPTADCSEGRCGIDWGK